MVVDVVECYDLAFCLIYQGTLFSNMDMSLSHPKEKGSNCTLYVLPLWISSFLTCFISSSCMFLMLIGSAKLILAMWQLSAILTLLKYSASASFGRQYMMDVMYHQDLQVSFV